MIRRYRRTGWRRYDRETEQLSACREFGRIEVPPEDDWHAMASLTWQSLLVTDTANNRLLELRGDRIERDSVVPYIGIGPNEGSDLHVNGVTVFSGLAYTTEFGAGPKDESHGVVRAANTGVVMEGLWQPHSPLVHPGEREDWELSVCDSARGGVRSRQLQDDFLGCVGANYAIYRGGYTRGLDYLGGRYYIGISKPRDKYDFIQPSRWGVDVGVVVTNRNFDVTETFDLSRFGTEVLSVVTL